MFDTIILLAGEAEQKILASLLRQHNPHLAVSAVSSLAAIDALTPDVMARSRLIGFATPVVVPKRILDALGFGAYNFHPGPPHYPGWLPGCFAVYGGAHEFGVTAHVMSEQVDTGPIVGVELFPVPPAASLRSLDELAFVQLARLFWQLAAALATSPEPLPALQQQWSGRRTTRRMVAGLCDIPIAISKEELDRRIDAFNAINVGAGLTVTLHGRKFRYVEADTETEAAPVLERKSA
jgi:methionyl-tRNA formyltransferase